MDTIFTETVVGCSTFSVTSAQNAIITKFNEAHDGSGVYTIKTEIDTTADTSSALDGDTTTVTVTGTCADCITYTTDAVATFDVTWKHECWDATLNTPVLTSAAGSDALTSTLLGPSVLFTINNFGDSVSTTYSTALKCATYQFEIIYADNTITTAGTAFADTFLTYSEASGTYTITLNPNEANDPDNHSSIPMSFRYYFLNTWKDSATEVVSTTYDFTYTIGACVVTSFTNMNNPGA